MKRGLFTLILMAGLGLTSLSQSAPAGQAGEDIQEKLRVAASQHEIIQTLLDSGQYENVLPEFQKILKLGLTGEQEKLVRDSAVGFVEQLREAEQYELAHRIIDQSLETLKSRESKFLLLIFKGKVFKDQGKIEEALEVFRRAQELRE